MKKLFLLLTMMLCTLSASAQEEYDLWFQGTRVNSSNCDDLMWGGMVRYDASSNTLSFDDQVWINNDYVNDYVIENKIAGLTIQFNGECGIEGLKGAIHSTEHFLISGNGADESSVMITDSNADSPAIYAEKGVTIQQCNVAIYGQEDTGIEGGGILALNGAKLYSDMVKGFDDMQYSNGSYLANPEGGQYDTVNKVLGEGYIYVQVDVRTAYALTVAGVAVTNENAADVLNDQTVEYDPTSKTLSLKDAKIQCEAEVIHSAIDGLTIRVIGDNVLTSQTASCIDYQGQNLTIEGYAPSRSTLRFLLNSDGGVAEDGSSTLSGNTVIKNCTVSGNKLLNANTEEPVTLGIQRARIAVADIEGFADVTVSNAYDKSSADGRYDIEPYLLAYNGQDVTPANPIVATSGTVTYDAATGMLTMKDADLGVTTAGEGITFYDDLTIKLEGANTLSAHTGALRFEAGDLTIQGPGRLEIYANVDAFADAESTKAYNFGFDQCFTLKKTNLYCSTFGRRVTAANLIYNVISSNFTFDQNTTGYAQITCKEMNLKYCKLVEPEDLNLDRYFPMFYGKIDIKASGDVNDDGELAATDVTGMIKHLNDDPSSVDMSVFDVDGDGEFTDEDVKILVDIILEKIEM